jgi:hypothetical protein
MTIVLRAICIVDAAAIAHVDGRLRLVRPPYALISSPQLNDADLADALARGGFEATTKMFSNYKELISFLRESHENWAKSFGLPLEGTLSADQFISGISTVVVRDVMDRISEDLIPAGLLEPAEALLLAMIRSTELTHELKIEAATLLVRTHAYQKVESDQADAQVDRRFETLQDPDTTSKVQRIKHRIRERYGVLEVRAEL